jgi:hypothetical protein
MIAIAAGLCAILAGALWAVSGTVKVPVIDNSYVEMVNVTPFYAALKKIAVLNIFAAVASLASAAFQMVGALAGSH